MSVSPQKKQSGPIVGAAITGKIAAPDVDEEKERLVKAFDYGFGVSTGLNVLPKAAYRAFVEDRAGGKIADHEVRIEFKKRSFDPMAMQMSIKDSVGAYRQQGLFQATGVLVRESGRELLPLAVRKMLRSRQGKH